MNWKVIKTNDDINYLLNIYHNFHDSCLVSLEYVSGACVNKTNFAMNPINTERNLCLTFQSQFKDCYSIELMFKKLVKLNLEPYNENFDCIINGVTLKKVEDLFFWSDCEGYSYPTGTWIIAKELMWREKF